MHQICGVQNLIQIQIHFSVVWYGCKCKLLKKSWELLGMVSLDYGIKISVWTHEKTIVWIASGITFKPIGLCDPFKVKTLQVEVVKKGVNPYLWTLKSQGYLYHNFSPLLFLQTINQNNYYCNYCNLGPLCNWHCNKDKAEFAMDMI